MAKQGETKTLTTGEAAKYCGVSFRTVIRWIERGKLKAFKLPGRGDNRIRVEDFINFLNENDIPIPSELQPQTKRVLVVDDDEAMAAAIKRTLTRQGYQVEVASNGFEAGEQLSQFKPSLMTLDLKMPMLDGMAVLKHIHAKKLPVKTLVVSGQSTEELQQALDEGADDTLHKPFENEELLTKVIALLGTAT